MRATVRDNESGREYVVGSEYVIGADGKGETRLTHTPEEESQPEWSADGKQIWFSVFASDASRIA